MAQIAGGDEINHHPEAFTKQHAPPARVGFKCIFSSGALERHLCANVFSAQEAPPVRAGYTFINSCTESSLSNFQEFRISNGSKKVKQHAPPVLGSIQSPAGHLERRAVAHKPSSGTDAFLSNFTFMYNAKDERDESLQEPVISPSSHRLGEYLTHPPLQRMAFTSAWAIRLTRIDVGICLGATMLVQARPPRIEQQTALKCSVTHTDENIRPRPSIRKLPPSAGACCHEYAFQRLRTARVNCTQTAHIFPPHLNTLPKLLSIRSGKTARRRYEIWQKTT